MARIEAIFTATALVGVGSAEVEGAAEVSVSSSSVAVVAGLVGNAVTASAGRTVSVLLSEPRSFKENPATSSPSSSTTVMLKITSRDCSRGGVSVGMRIGNGPVESAPEPGVAGVDQDGLHGRFASDAEPVRGEAFSTGLGLAGIRC